MDENFLAGVELEEVELTSGFRGRLPVRYYDSLAIAGYFPAPAAKVRELLPSDKLNPVLFAPGTVVLCLTALEHHEVADLPPYNELFINILVQFSLVSTFRHDPCY